MNVQQTGLQVAMEDFHRAQMANATHLGMNPTGSAFGGGYSAMPGMPVGGVGQHPGYGGPTYPSAPGSVYSAGPGPGSVHSAAH
jgi:hypothetical protein